MSRVFSHSHQPRHRNDNNNNKGVNALNSLETEGLLTSFPNTRLSYEATIHKNDNKSLVSGAYKCFILPKGKRCIAWVTEWNRTKIVAVIDILGTNRYDGPLTKAIRHFHEENGWYPGAVRIYDACIEQSLVYGTVFSGVLFRTGANYDKSFFSIHTIHWYKGNPIPPVSLSGHVRMCERIFDECDIRQVAYTKQNSIVFGLPILCHNEKDVYAIVPELPYPVFAIQYRFENHSRVCQRLYQPGDELAAPVPVPAPVPVKREETKYVPVHVPVSAHAHAHAHAPATRRMYVTPTDGMLTNIQATFIVRPNIQNDIYELFVKNTSSRTNELVFHNFAHISSYKTSVMMNKLFRNIVENARLDTQEESEDEVEFENTEPDKYVSLHKEFIMVCQFHKRFCRWVPIQLSALQTTSLSHVITDQQVKQHEMRYLKYMRK
jgi:hypothetical protein